MNPVPSDRSVIVTGAASGIGRAIAGRLVADGWKVVGVDRDAAGLDGAAAELGDSFRVVAGDVADRRVLNEARRSAAQWAPLAAAVGCAGITKVCELVDVTDEHFDQVVDINQRGLLWTAAEAVDEWVSRKAPGVFVAISSVHARHAATHHAVYEMTKAAAEALVRSISVTYGPQRIRAVAVAPGAVRTPALEASLASAADPAAARLELEHFSPLRRLAEPAEIAAAVAFAISDDAGYLSGESITVDGGWSAVLAQASDDPGARRSG